MLLFRFCSRCSYSRCLAICLELVWVCNHVHMHVHVRAQRSSAGATIAVRFRFGRGGARRMPAALFTRPPSHPTRLLRATRRAASGSTTSTRSLSRAPMATTKTVRVRVRVQVAHASCETRCHSARGSRVMFDSVIALCECRVCGQRTRLRTGCLASASRSRARATLTRTRRRHRMWRT